MFTLQVDPLNDFYKICKNYIIIKLLSNFNINIFGLMKIHIAFKRASILGLYRNAGCHPNFLYLVTKFDELSVGSKIL